MDAVMGDFFEGGWANLARGGRYVVYGAADLTPAGDLAWFNVLGWAKRIGSTSLAAAGGPDQPAGREQERHGV